MGQVQYSDQGHMSGIQMDWYTGHEQVNVTEILQILSRSKGHLKTEFQRF